MNWRLEWDRQRQLNDMSLQDYEKDQQLRALEADLRQGEADYVKRRGTIQPAGPFSLRDYLYQGHVRRMGPDSAKRVFGDGNSMGVVDALPLFGLVDGFDGAVDASQNGFSAGNVIDMGFGALDALGIGAAAKGLKSLSRGGIGYGSR
jgi:hypothetical protein